MELNEIQNMWAQYDKKLAENTRLNKEILKRMLLAKPEKRLQWMRIKAGYRMLTPLLLLIPLLWVDFDFQFTINFFIGLGMFMAVCVYTYIGDVKCFLLIRKINSSEAVLSIKKKIAELEKRISGQPKDIKEAEMKLKQRESEWKALEKQLRSDILSFKKQSEQADLQLKRLALKSPAKNQNSSASASTSASSSERRLSFTGRTYSSQSEEMKQKNEAIHIHEATITELTKQVDSLKKTVDEMTEAKHEQELRYMEESKATQEAHQAVIEQLNLQIKSVSDDLEKALKVLQQEKDNHNREISNLKLELAECCEKCESYEERFKLSRRSPNFKLKSKEGDEETHLLRKQLMDAQDNLRKEKLRNKLSMKSALQTVEKMIVERDTLKRGIEDAKLSGVMVGHSKEIVTIRDKKYEVMCDRQGKEIESLKTELEEARTIKLALERQLKAHGPSRSDDGSGRIAQLEHMINSASTEVEQLRLRVNELMSREFDLRTRVSSRDEEIRLLNIALAHYKRKNFV